MAKLTKKQKAQDGVVESTKLYALADAIELVKKHATAKFDESIDVAVQLGIDAKKSDQVVRGAVVLPNGTGKTKRVAVFAQGAKADEAKAPMWWVWTTWLRKSRPAKCPSTSSSLPRTPCVWSVRWARSWARVA